MGRGRIGVGGALLAVVGSYLAVRTGGGDALDARARGMLARELGPGADRAVAAATDLGSIYALAGVSTALAVGGHRRAAREVAAAGAAAWVAAQGTKPLLDRERPYQLRTSDRLVAEPVGTSWPSGHAALTAAMSAAVWDSAGSGTRAGLVVATAGVAVSRCYVGVHHLTDVVAGVGLGVLSSRASRAILRRLAG